MEQLQLLWELQEIEREIRQKEKELQNLASVIKYKQQKTAFLDFLEEKKKAEERYAGEKKSLKHYEIELQNISDNLRNQILSYINQQCQGTGAWKKCAQRKGNDSRKDPGFYGKLGNGEKKLRN